MHRTDAQIRASIARVSAIVLRSGGEQDVVEIDPMLRAAAQLRELAQSVITNQHTQEVLEAGSDAILTLAEKLLDTREALDSVKEAHSAND